MAVADPADAVFPPAIGARACHVVRKIFPRRSPRTVILANRSPLPLGKVRPPALPMLGALVRFVQTLFFGCHREVPRSGPVKGSEKGSTHFSLWVLTLERAKTHRLEAVVLDPT